MPPEERNGSKEVARWIDPGRCSRPATQCAICAQDLEARAVEGLRGLLVRLNAAATFFDSSTVVCAQASAQRHTALYSEVARKQDDCTLRMKSTTHAALDRHAEARRRGTTRPASPSRTYAILSGLIGIEQVVSAAAINAQSIGVVVQEPPAQPDRC